MPNGGDDERLEIESDPSHLEVTLVCNLGGRIRLSKFFWRRRRRAVLLSYGQFVYTCCLEALTCSCQFVTASVLTCHLVDRVFGLFMNFLVSCDFCPHDDLANFISCVSSCLWNEFDGVCVSLWSWQFKHLIDCVSCVGTVFFLFFQSW